jgi:hypothetical protein
MTRLRTLTCFLGLLLGSRGVGQVNVEQYRDATKGVLVLSYEEGSTRTSTSEAFTGELILHKIYKQHAFLAVGGLTREKNDGETITDETLAHGRYFYRLKPKTNDEDLGLHQGPEVFVQSAKNTFSNQRKRTLYGLGWHWVWKRPTSHWRGGTSFLREKLTLEPLTKDLFPDHLVSTWINRFNGYTTYHYRYLTATLYYQPNLDDLAEHNIVVDATIAVPLGKSFEWLLSLDYTRNRTLDIKDYTFFQSLSLQF